MNLRDKINNHPIVNTFKKSLRQVTEKLNKSVKSLESYCHSYSDEYCNLSGFVE